MNNNTKYKLQCENLYFLFVDGKNKTYTTYIKSKLEDELCNDNRYPETWYLL